MATFRMFYLVTDENYEPIETVEDDEMGVVPKLRDKTVEADSVYEAQMSLPAYRRIESTFEVLANGRLLRV